LPLKDTQVCCGSLEFSLFLHHKASLVGRLGDLVLILDFVDGYMALAYAEYALKKNFLGARKKLELKLVAFEPF
jgi:hypothetical protein